MTRPEQRDAGEPVAQGGQPRAPDQKSARKLARKSDRTREEILATAARLFRRRGVDGTSLRHIAAEARLGAGSIYYHFASRDEIIGAVLDRGLRGIFDAVRDLLADKRAEGADFRETLAVMVAAHLHHLHAAVDFTSTNIRNFSQLPQEIQQRHRPLRRDYAALWDSMLTEAQGRGEIRADIPPETLRSFILGALNWTVEWFDPARAPLAEPASEISRMVLDGIGTDEMRGAPIGVADDSLPAEETALPGERQRHEAILRSAARLIRDRGYTAATLRDIAAGAGLEAGSVYYHFGSKAAILDEVLDRGLRGMRDELAARMVLPCDLPAEHRTRVADAIGAHLGHLLAQAEFTSANIRNYGRLPGQARQRHRPVRADYAALWEKVLSEARAAGAIRQDIRVPLLRRVILGALNWTVEWFRDEPTRPEFIGAEDYTAMCVGLILDGIAPRRAESPTRPLAANSNGR